MKNVQYIYFESPSKQIAIAKEGYEQVKQTIEGYRVCGTCGRLFSQENPQVSLNWCKECFVQRGKGKQHGLTYLGLVSPEPTQYNGIEHKFIKAEGYIYVTGSESEITHDMTYYNKNNRQTLAYWQFPVIPEIYELNGEEVRLHDLHMCIYGDIRTAAAVVINYSENYTYSPSINVVFLAYRNGTYEELNKRKGEGRKLWLEARARLEASKDAQGDYHVNGYSHSQMYADDPYYFIVDILNEREQQKQLEQRKEQAVHPIDQNIQPGATIQLSLTAYDEARLQQQQDRQQ